MNLPRVKAGCYLLEGLNALATAYYFNYLLFLLRDQFGFGNLQNLLTGAVHGLLYVVFSLVGGRLGQRFGYFTLLRAGFAGMAISLCLGWGRPSLAAQLVVLALWTVTMCFTWPMLEALVCEHEDAATLPHRIGLYNVVWAATAGLAYFFGGMLFEALGPGSLYWLPAAIHLAQWLLTFPLQRAHDRWRAAAPAIRGEAAVQGESAGQPAYFQKLAFLANPFAYMAINTLLAVVPGIAERNGLGVAEAGRIMSLWFCVRTVTFGVLWFWHGWHYRFSWFAGSFLLLIGGFFTLMVADSLWQLLLAQLAFGWAAGLIYYSSLFYAMDGSTTKGEHGGQHEALIGAGICGGPALGALSLWLAPHLTNAAAWTVGGFLVLGLGGIFRLRARDRTPPG